MEKHFSAGLMACGAALALVSAPVSAQSLREVENAGQSEMRGMASLTIPLGGPRSARESKPRLDFAMESARIGGDQFASSLTFDRNLADRAVLRRTALSFTLEQRPTMMLNGQPMTTFGPRLGADEDDEKGGGGNAGLYILGGVLAFGVIGTIVVVTDTRDAVSDVIGPAD
ncbi:hypothetical protein [Parerythrobacter jejuensis]|uniref:Uncharacterized protein n=1 Tax=Parerythrobacter jejuensis TaxID=795812 RepID=A0A845AVZ3_9SPHN|nr:hypothetical protein [Parerythrobacter jejuensis]MXP32676.1 hypothetical protein [Parerythrobacter jejuensis]